MVLSGLPVDGIGGGPHVGGQLVLAIAEPAGRVVHLPLPIEYASRLRVEPVAPVAVRAVGAGPGQGQGELDRLLDERALVALRELAHGDARVGGQAVLTPHRRLRRDVFPLVLVRGWDRVEGRVDLGGFGELVALVRARRLGIPVFVRDVFARPWRLEGLLDGSVHLASELARVLAELPKRYPGVVADLLDVVVRVGQHRL
mmetsp:Transcript_90673/g.236129  ORF Transcript_90673/g.236129 Transcript_90673/m.236129 type:complete len:201 (-) Transcript_90673:115-717(-)